MPRDSIAYLPHDKLPELGYRPTGDRPILYSVGCDGKDNGGDGAPQVLPVNERRGVWEFPDFVFDLNATPRVLPATAPVEKEEWPD